MGFRKKAIALLKSLAIFLSGFNPQAKKGSQMLRYFVEVRAIFKDGLYVVEEMLREPTLKIPKFIKLSNKKQPKSVEKTAQKSELAATT